MKTSGEHLGIKWSWFERERDGRKRFILKYSVTSGEWTPVTAPKEIRTKNEFRRWMLAEIEQIHATGARPVKQRGGPTVRSLFDDFKAFRREDPEVQEATYRDNVSAFNKHVLPKWGDRTVVSIDEKELRPWVRELARKLSPSRCRNVVYSFKVFFKVCKAEGWVPLRYNPFDTDDIKDVLPSVKKKRFVVHFDAKAAQSLIENQTFEFRRVVRYVIGIGTGASDGEIAALRICDVNLEGDVPQIRITHAVQLLTKGEKSPREKNGRTRGNTKTENRVRVVPLCPAVVQCLNEWIETGWEKWTGMPPSPNSPLLPSARGEFSRPDMAAYLRDDLESSKLPTHDPDGKPYEFRTLRRTFSTLLQEFDVPLEHREALMGHGASSVNNEFYTGGKLRALYRSVCLLPLTWKGGERPSKQPRKSDA